MALTPHLASGRRRQRVIFYRGKNDTITAPYPWATTKRAIVHPLEYLIPNGINTITGAVQCQKCTQRYEIEYELALKFSEIASYVSHHKHSMSERAPSVWMHPALPDCRFCGENNSVKPVTEKKRSINWLFLLLGNMLGCCKLADLKYFCKHTSNCRTGARDRVLYVTYLELYKQLDPIGAMNI